MYFLRFLVTYDKNEDKANSVPAVSGILATRHWTHWSVTKLQPDMSRVSSAASWGPQPVKAAWQTAV